MVDDTKKVFLLTDACLWEMNKKNKTSTAHGIEVVDIETGQVRYIRSGSHIKFVEGSITENREQNTYNSRK